MGGFWTVENDPLILIHHGDQLIGRTSDNISDRLENRISRDKRFAGAWVAVVFQHTDIALADAADLRERGLRHRMLQTVFFYDITQMHTITCIKYYTSIVQYIKQKCNSNEIKIIEKYT